MHPLALDRGAPWIKAWAGLTSLANMRGGKIVVTLARCCPARAAARERARATLQVTGGAEKGAVGWREAAPRPCTPTAATSSAGVPSVSDDDFAELAMPLGQGRRSLGRGTKKIVASRLCALRASTSAVRQADRLRGAAHPVVNIRISEHHILSRPLLRVSDVRLVGQEARKRVLELRCPVTVPREIGSLSRMNDDGTNIILSQQPVRPPASTPP